MGSHEFRVYGRMLNTALATVVAMVPLAALAAYHEADLVSDVPGLAAITDMNLVNPWGIAASPTGPFWVADNGTGLSTLYDGTGQPFPLATRLVVTIPPPAGSPPGTTAAPTGLVFNGKDEFHVTEGGNSGASVFIFSTEDGTIAGWSPTVNLMRAVIAVDNSAQDAIYKGLALGTNAAGDYLFATDFHNNRVDVFDQNFAPASLSGAFSDPSIPAGFAPFGIHNIGGQLYVTYAQQDADAKDDVHGPGLGFVNVFDTDGNLLRRFTSAGTLNAPWGVALAPVNFGEFSNAVLIGNFGDGHINAFAPGSGAFLGQLMAQGHQPITISGLWGLQFGNGASAGATDTLFFTAGIDDEQHGLFGSVRATTLAPGQIDLVNVSPAGLANGASGGPAMSTDGSTVAFFSDASNLVPDDTNNVRDVFVAAPGGPIERISVSGTGAQGDGASNASGGSPAISDDGQQVAFYSAASNLVPSDTNNVPDVFVRDRGAGTTERVSVATDGSQANGASFFPSISADGHLVAFQSQASDLVDGDTNGVSDIFVRDRVSGTTERVCSVQGNDFSTSPSISADGNFVAFASRASNLVPDDTNARIDVFVCDRGSGTLQRVSVASDGTQGNGDSILPDISADGRIVVFKSLASNLVPGDRNGLVDVFAYDRTTGMTERISVSRDGGDADDVSFPPSISDDGRFVVFGSLATNLVALDHNRVADVFVRDRVAETTLLVDVNALGEQANRGTVDAAPAISGDGSTIGFVSFATNLAGPDNATANVFSALNPFVPPTPPIATPTPTATPGPPTATETAEATETPEATESTTPTATPAATENATATTTPAATGTTTATATPAGSGTATSTVTPAASETATSTPTPAGSGTATSTVTPAASETATSTPTPAGSGTATSTVTPAASETATSTPTPAGSGTATSTVTPAASETATSTPTPAGSGTATSTMTPAASETATSTPTPAGSETVTSTVTPAASETVTSTPTPAASETATATSTPAATETVTPTQTPEITETPQVTPTTTLTATATATATETTTPAGLSTGPQNTCVGACGAARVVTIADLITGVNISLGGMPLETCPAFDADGSQTVSIDEIIRAVNNALDACP